MNKQIYDYSISAIGDEISEEKVMAALQAVGLAKVQVEKILNFELFVEGLPGSTVEGFAQRCAARIDTWIKEGGDWPTGDMLLTVCRDDGESNPKTLANKMYHSIAGVTCMSYKASAILVPMISECLNEA